MRYSVSVLSVLTVLAGCGGSGNGSGEPAFQEVEATTLSDGGVLSLTDRSPDARGLFLRLEDGTGGLFSNMNADNSRDVEEFKYFATLSLGVAQTHAFEQRRDEGYVEIVAVQDPNIIAIGPYVPGANVHSVGGTVPTSGSAIYTGDYLGFLARGASTTEHGLTESQITGDVRLEAEFAGGTLGGQITNRQRFLSIDGSEAAYDLEDLTLAEVDIVGGVTDGFGATEGGKLSTSSAVPEAGDLSGNWQAAFGGDEGGVVFGSVEVDHDYEQGLRLITHDYVELGVFVADKE
ncbi:MAG: hypothetical protein AAFQ09_02835 [Pseudomonadota bacterium]